ncbi:MAG: hypothetical protein ABMA25_02020 [Ilumatobacteraceae bacterium]
MDGRVDRVISLAAAVLALLALAAAGIVGINVVRGGDMETVFGLFSVPGQWQLPLSAVLLAMLAAAVALRHARWAWAVVVIAGLTAVFCFGVGAAIASDARDINGWIAVEGTTAGVDSPLTRAMGGGSSPVTSVDADGFHQIMIAVGILELICVAAAAWSLWARRRAGVVPVADVAAALTV